MPLANLRLVQAGVAKHDPCSVWVFQVVSGYSINADLMRRRARDQDLFFAHPMFRPQTTWAPAPSPDDFYGFAQKLVDGFKQRLAARGIFCAVPGVDSAHTSHRK